MNISDRHSLILTAKICPYCDSKTIHVSESYIYGKEYKGRKMIVCANFPSCDSYVGTHDDGTPLGRLANKTLRNAKINAHYWFDKIWKEGFIERSELYSNLSDYLNIPKEYTHIGMFSEITCLTVKDWAEALYKEVKI